MRVAAGDITLINSLPHKSHRTTTVPLYICASLKNNKQHSSLNKRYYKRSIATNSFRYTSMSRPARPPPSIPWSTMNKPLSTSGTDSKAADKFPPPSPSASTLLISPENRILLLHRLKTSSSFPSAHVFPGGNLEPSDGALPSSPTDPQRHVDSLAYRTGAIRELFEESGVLIARTGSGTELLSVKQDVRLHGRGEVHAGRVRITDWLRRQSESAVLDTDGLVPFSHWVTPTNVPKRFSTQMYLYFVPVDAKRQGKGEDLLATPDEVETLAPEWRSAREWLQMCRSGEVILFPPQYLLLSFVSRFLDRDGESIHDVSEEERLKRRQDLRDFVEGKGGVTDWRTAYISPTPIGRWTDGRSVLGLDFSGVELKDSGLKGNNEWVVLVKFSKEGPREVEVMERKFVEDELARIKKEKNGKL